MARFCSRCGKELQEGVKFCSGCGAPVEGGAPGGMPGSNMAGGMPGNNMAGGMPGSNMAGGSMAGGMPGSNMAGGMPGGGMPGVAAQPKKMNPILLIAAAAVVLVVVIIAAVKIFAGGSGYMKPIKYLEKGFNKRDVKMIQKAFADSGDISTDIFADIEELGGIIDYKIELDVVDKEKVDKRDIEDVLIEDYYVNEIYAKNASAAYILEVEMTLEMGEYSEDETEEIPVAKINGKWVIPESFGYFF